MRKGSLCWPPRKVVNPKNFPLCGNICKGQGGGGGDFSSLIFSLKETGGGCSITDGNVRKFFLFDVFPQTYLTTATYFTTYIDKSRTLTKTRNTILKLNQLIAHSMLFFLYVYPFFYLLLLSLFIRINFASIVLK